MMPRMSRRVDDVQKEFAEDFTVVNDNLLLCKFCDTIVKWQKKTRILEHLNTKMHAERKELKLQRLISEMHSQGANDDDDFEQDDDIVSAHESIWENEESGIIDPNEAQYSLKWKNHKNNMLDVFNRLLGNEQLTDVLIAAEGRKIRAHKVILSACSSYFENLFMTFDEKNQIVILKDASFIDVYALIEFIYKGEVNIGQDRLPSLLQTAESLRVKGLSESSTQDNTATTNNENYRYKSSSSYGNVKYRRCDNPPEMKFKEEPFSPLQESSPFISTPKKSNLSTMDKLNTKFPFECKNSAGSGISSKYINHSPKVSNLSSDKSLYVTGTIGSSSNVGGLNTITQSTEHLKFASGNGAVLPSLAGSCEQLKKKRGRPRILDSDSDVQSYLIDIDEDRTANFNIQGNEVADSISEPVGTESPSKNKSKNKMPTPGGPLTEERIKELGVIKMNDYLSSGTRPQFWEEYFVKVIMHAVKNKEIDVKGAAELLGVSYGTLYGRYRELFGYVKHAWNLAGRPMKLFPMSNHMGFLPGSFTKEPSAAIWTDPSNQDILEQLKNGNITIRQAAELLGIEPAVLAYQLSGKAPGDDIANIDYDPAIIPASNDVDMEDDDNYYISNNIATEVEINENTSKIAHKDTSKSSIKITKVQTSSNVDQKYYDQHNCNDEENGLPAPIVIAK